MITIDTAVLENRKFDVCIVGSGPVGSCLAIDLAYRGLSVLVLESGLRKSDPIIQALSDANITYPSSHHPMAIAISRTFGGTSKLWGGRCAPLDEIDFRERSHIPNSGWPIGLDQFAKFERRAAELLGCDDGSFFTGNTAGYDGDVDFHKLERWVNQIDITRQHPDLGKNHRIVVLLNATVTGLCFGGESRRVEGLRVARKGYTTVFSNANDYVLALGGVETARLLLNVQKEHPLMFGGDKGPLGRYYMGHVSGSMARLQFGSRLSISLFENIVGARSFGRRRLTLSAEAQTRHQLPNIAFWPDNDSLSDAHHKSGFLSLAYLLLKTPYVGSNLVSQAIQEMHNSAAPYASHFRNIALDPTGTIKGIMEAAGQRYLFHRRVPRVFITNKSGIYPLHFHAEQIPSPTNRIRLIEERDSLGMNRVAIDFRFDPSEINGVRKAHDILDEWLQRVHLGRLIYNQPASTLAGFEPAPDGLHQIGLTRMSTNPSTGIVDENCQVFGLNNLFIAGSAVFRTSGQASPTLPAVTLALRLAEQIEYRQSLRGRSCTVAAHPRTEMRILFVTASYYPAVRYGGPIYTVHSLARALVRRGHRVTVYTTNVDGDESTHSPDKSVRNIDGVTIHYFSAPIKRIYWSPSMIEALIANNDSFDVIHAQGAFLYPTVAARRVAERGQIPFVYSPRGMLVNTLIRQKNAFAKGVWIKCFEYENCSKASFIHATSDIEAQEIAATGLQTQAIEVIPNGVDAPEFRSNYDDEMRRTLYLGSVYPYVIVLGRVSWKKGLDRLIRAFQYVPNVKLVVAGNDEENFTPRLRGLAAELGLSDQVVFTGPVYGLDKFALLRGAKLFVLPSYSESFGVVLLEALSCGCPVVMTPEVGVAHELEKLGAGSVSPGTPKELAETINKLLANPELIRQMSNIGKESIVEMYSWDHIAESMERAYRNALAREKSNMNIPKFEHAVG